MKSFLELNDEELRKEVKELFNVYLKNPHSGSSTIFNAYQNELNRRTIEKNVKSTEELIIQQQISQEQARKWSKWTIWLSIFTLILAASTIVFAFVDFISDKYWMKDQKELLIKIDNSINDLDKTVYVVQEADSTMKNIMKH